MNIFIILILSLASGSIAAQTGFTPDSPYSLSGRKLNKDNIVDKLEAYEGREWEKQEMEALHEKIVQHNDKIHQKIIERDEKITKLISTYNKINEIPYLSSKIISLETDIANCKLILSGYQKKQLIFLQNIKAENISLEKEYQNKNNNPGEEYLLSFIKILEKELQATCHIYDSHMKEVERVLESNNIQYSSMPEMNKLKEARGIINNKLRKLNQSKQRVKSDEILAILNYPVQISSTQNHDIAEKVLVLKNNMEEQYGHLDAFFVTGGENQKIEYKKAKRYHKKSWIYIQKREDDKRYLSLLSQYNIEDYLQREKKIRNNFTEKVEGIMLEMIYVEGGDFLMGSPKSDIESQDDERPVHEVYVPDFYIGKYEVTQEQWEAVMGNNPSANKKCDHCPVENVSLDDVKQFLKQLNYKTGKHYRLPSEAEWEYAARGGQKSQGFLYAGSNDIRDVSASYGDRCKSPKKVGAKDPNELGIYDMSGNVWEWVADCWHDNYENAPDDGSAWTENCGHLWVNRGGSCGYHERYARIGNRNDDHPSRGRDVVGFRLVLSAEY